MKKLSILIGSAAASMAVLSIAVAAHRTGAVVGAAAPTFSATDASGKSIKLSDFKGKYVVLEWANFECPYVKKHYGSGNMQALQKKYTAKGVEWLTILSMGPDGVGYLAPDKLKAMAKEQKLASTLVPDPKGTIGHLYGATNTPDMFVIDPEGNVIYTGAIDSDRSPDPEAIKNATNYVAAALDESMAGKPVTVKKSRPYGCGIQYGH